ncbi:hypothetical protein AVEN_64583-1 [Araneus ventricosus]|uniref:Uncharacterized protein n=1 Tax=Araneus ventricosus TaxID=182803 RepID=A0A4Y2W6Z7_ARAVE|nr:hypothetical protein AVEN_64583-1 [Araneus ventricosus]
MNHYNREDVRWVTIDLKNPQIAAPKCIKVNIDMSFKLRKQPPLQYRYFGCKVYSPEEVYGAPSLRRGLISSLGKDCDDMAFG